MKKYIDVEKLIEHKSPSVKTPYMRGWNDAIDAIIYNEQTEDVMPVVHSNWRAENNPSYSPFDSTMDDEVYFCNNCNNKQYKMSSYCSCCGAKMDLEEQDAP